MAHARVSLAAVRQSNVLDLENPDPFGSAALQELLIRTLKILAGWHPRNSARVVELALRGGLEAADRALRELIAELTERRESLNSALVTYNNIIADGRTIVYRQPASRPRESPLAAFIIIVLIIDLLREFPMLNLRRSSTRHPSACSIISAVLIEAGIGRGGEEAIRKIWERYGPPVMVPAGPSERTMLRALVSRETQEK